MSGFYGAYVRPGGAPLPPGLLDTMDRAIAHRGPHAHGHASDAGWGLGQRSLWTTPEAVDKKPPFRLVEPELVCVGDVRLDEREELAEALGIPTAEERQLADEELLLRCFARWGRASLPRLVGAFAFALWDGRDRSLCLVRDPVGLRPCYFAETRDRVLFGTQPRVLFADAGLPCGLDHLRVADYLARHFPHTSRTIHAGVRRLPPGHCLWLAGDRSELSSYHRFDPDVVLEPQDARGYAEGFLETFTEAVRCRRRARGELGLFLSGGLDSSGVAGVLRRQGLKQPLPCFSARFPQFPGVDEGPYLELQYAAGELEPHGAPVDGLSPLDSASFFYAYLDEPFYGANAYVSRTLAELAHARGVSVVLDGLDGDTSVDHGWLLPNVLLHQGRLRRALRATRAMAQREQMPLSAVVKGRVLHPDIEALRIARGLYAPLGWRRRPPGLMAPELCRDTRWVDWARDRMAYLLRPETRFSHLHHRSVTSPLIAFLMEVEDHAAAVFGQDHRHPYFDQRLVAFCLSLPGEQRLFDGWDRVVQRRAFEGLVPEPIRKRQTKSVWVQVFDRQLARDAPRIEALLDDPRRPLEGLVDRRRARRALELLRRGRPGPHVLDLWLVASLGLWLTETPLGRATGGA